MSGAELLGVRADSGGSLTAVRPARRWLTAHSLPTSLSTPRGDERPAQHAPTSVRPGGAGWSPAGVAADDNVPLRHHLPADGVWHDSGRHRELDGRLEAEYANLRARIRYCAAYSEHGVTTPERGVQ